jgi:hypothetical protein
LAVEVVVGQRKEMVSMVVVVAVLRITIAAQFLPLVAAAVLVFPLALAWYP